MHLRKGWKVRNPLCIDRRWWSLQIYFRGLAKEELDPRKELGITLELCESSGITIPTGKDIPLRLEMDFYLPLPGQPRITELHSWRAPIRMEQGNEGIYVRIDEWKDTYGTNVYVIDEVTGRIYADIGGDLKRIQVICSHRKRDEKELELVLKERGAIDTRAGEAAGDKTAPPPPINTHEKLRGVGPEQAQLNVASVKAQVRDEQMSAATPLGRERIESSPLGLLDQFLVPRHHR